MQLRTTAHQQESRANAAIAQSRAAVQRMYICLADNSQDSIEAPIPARRRELFLKVSASFFESLDRDQNLDDASELALARILHDMGDVHLRLEEYRIAEDLYARALVHYAKCAPDPDEFKSAVSRLQHVKETINKLPPESK